MSNSFEVQATTLAYIVCRGKCLFIRKTRKGDMNLDKYLGVGGHMESGESPEDCIIREIEEETGLVREDLKSLELRGHVTFVSDEYGTEYMHVFAGTMDDVPALRPCDEGELVWVDLEDIYGLPVWEGDKIMFRLLFDEVPDKFFSLKLCYEGDKLVTSEKICY